MSYILVTGGAGYIGSHTCVELLENGYQVVVVDNLSNSSAESLKRVEKITGKSVDFRQFDLCDTNKLRALFDEFDFDGVVHFAGLKAVGESVEQPLGYYRNNIDSTLSLCEAMRSHDVTKLIFSSSATVYGNASELPLKESSPVGNGITNPYGQTKFMIEQILRDVVAADPSWHVTILRYFNPIGAHESGLIGEDPDGIPNNLLPFVAQVAIGRREKVKVYGNDYDTPDGSGVRDYIHVVDLAKGHVAALEKIRSGVHVYNLGTGTGSSVLEVIKAFEAAAGKTIPFEIAPRRPGDVASSYADCSLAEHELGWRAGKSLQDACEDAWRWQSQNPEGFLKINRFRDR
jgi:UDP-glucose 4-epimerase